MEPSTSGPCNGLSKPPPQIALSFSVPEVNSQEHGRGQVGASEAFEGGHCAEIQVTAPVTFIPSLDTLIRALRVGDARGLAKLPPYPHTFSQTAASHLIP